MPIDPNYQAPISDTTGNETVVSSNVYQVEIVDISMVQGKKYQSEEKEDKFKFVFAIVEPGKFFKCVLKKKFSVKLNPPFNNGNASGLYSVFCAALNAQLTKKECQSFMANIGVHANELEGKQLKITVKKLEGDDGFYNKITDYLPAETPIKFNRSAQAGSGMSDEDEAELNSMQPGKPTRQEQADIEEANALGAPDEDELEV